MRTKESERLARQILNKHKLYSDDGSKGYHTDSSIVDAMFEFNSQSRWVLTSESAPNKSGSYAFFEKDFEEIHYLYYKVGVEIPINYTHWQEITPPGI